MTRKTCEACGKALEDDARLCPSCAQTTDAPNGKKNPPTYSIEQALSLAKTLGGTVSAAMPALMPGTLSASAMAGETLVSNGFSLVPRQLKPYQVLMQGLMRVITAFKTAFRTKKGLMPALILGISWIVLSVLPVVGINPFPVKLLSFLTFAQGGISNNPISIVGGVLGKTLYATFLFTLLGDKDPLPKLKSTFGMFKAIFKNEKIHLGLPVRLLGLSMALIGFHFFMGLATPWSLTGGLATIFLSLKALTSNGFLMRLLSSCFTGLSAIHAKKYASTFISGLTLGFTLATAMGMVSWSYAPIVLGILLTIVSAIWLVLGIVAGKLRTPKAEGGAQ